MSAVDERIRIARLDGERAAVALQGFVETLEIA